MKLLRASILVSIFVVLTVALIPAQALLNWLDPDNTARRLPTWYHRLMCGMLGMRIVHHGELDKTRPLLIVANHTSWLDIPILSTIAPVAFVAKREVADWPLFGILAKLQRTVFVERARRHDTGRQRNEIHARLEQGDRLILFPEGTSSDGNHVLPFNSALFGVAELPLRTPEGTAPVVVQPVSVAYTRLHGLPMSRRMRPLFAWYGNMDLVPHLWGAFGAGPLDVDIAFHRPVTLAELGSRKALSRHCRAEICAGLSGALSGRPGAEGLKSGLPLVAPPPALSGA